MRELRSLVRLPFALPSGEVVRTPGFHEATGAYADFDAECLGDLPESPTREELETALRQMWRPWAAYKFATEHDRAGMLAGIIGVVCRPGIDLGPGLVFDAPMPGSGKTLAAQALGAVALGRRCAATIGVNFSDEDEMRKTLVADAIAGSDVILLDNLHGHLSSAALEGLMTGGGIKGRVLGASLNFDGEVRSTVLLTSNNASLSVDLARRFMRVRIDHGVEAPQRLEFRHCPVERALTERLGIARAVLVVVQAYFAAGVPRLGRGDAGYPEWNRLVRQTVLWASREGLTEEAGIGRVGDPAHFIMEEAGRSDPDSAGLAMLLEGLTMKFGDEFFLARAAVAWLESWPRCEAAMLVREAVETLMPGRGGPITAASLGNVLKYRVDRPCCGLVLRKAEGAKKTTVYSVQLA